LRLRRLAAAACVLLVAAFAAIAIAVYYFDPRPFALSLAASVKADTGRELGFGGVAVTLLPRPALALSEVRFGNAAWGSQPWLAQAGRVRADVDALALLGGRLRIKHVTMTDAKVFLETDRDGNGNWVLSRADAGASAWLRELEIDELALQALALTYRDGVTGRVTSARFDAARIAANSASRPLQLSARGTFEGKRVEVAGTIGTMAALIANASAYPVDLEAKVGAASMSVHGTIDKSQELGRFSLALGAEMPEFAELAALFGATVPPLGPFRGTTRLTGTATAPVFSGIDVELGTPEQIDLRARGEFVGKVSSSGNYEWQSAGVDLLLQGAQLGDLARLLGQSLPALGPFRMAAHMAGPAAAPELSAIDITIGGRQTPEINLRGAVSNVRAASGIDLQLVASASDWWRLEAGGGLRLPPFRASARVRDFRQGYRVDGLELRIADSIVNASLQVARGSPRPRVTGRASSPLIDLARMPPAPRAATAPSAGATARAGDHWKLADLDLDLQIGRLVFPDGRQLQSGRGRIQLDNGRLKARALQATLGGANTKLDGSVADPQSLTGLDLNVALQGSELAELFKFFGKSIPAVGAYQGHAELHGSLDALRVTAIDATIGPPGQRLRASGQINDALHWRGVELALAANISDSTAAGHVFGADLPRLPAFRATARLSGPQGGYTFDDLTLALGRTSVQGRVLFAPADPRPRITANLSGPLVDLSELPLAQPKPGEPNPLLAADVEADIRLNRVVLPNRRALGPVSGSARLTAGAAELKQFIVAVDGASATLDGRIDDPLKPAGLELMVNAKVTHTAGLGAFTGLHMQNFPAFTANGKLTDVPNGYAIAGLQLASAATTITGDVTVTRGATRFKVSAKARAPFLDFSAFTGPAGTGDSAKPAASGTRAIPDVPLPGDFLRVIDADLDLRFETVKFSTAAPLGPLLARAVIADGRFKAEPVQLTIQPGQTLTVTGTVDAAQTKWALRIEGAGIDFGEMLARFGRPGLVTGGSTDLAVQVQGSGKSLAAILGSLNGDARVKVGPHRVHNFAIDLESGIVSRMFALANPFRKTEPDTDIRCLAARVPIRNGVLTSERNVAVETAKYNAVMSGTLNLGTELIDAAVTPIVKTGIGMGEVTTIVRVRGTLAAPTVSVDPISVVAQSAASTGAAVMTFGASWMAETLIRKAAADPHPCATALAQ